MVEIGVDPGACSSARRVEVCAGVSQVMRIFLCAASTGGHYHTYMLPVGAKKFIMHCVLLRSQLLCCCSSLMPQGMLMVAGQPHAACSVLIFSSEYSTGPPC